MINYAHKRTFGPIPKYPLVEEYKRKGDDFVFIAGPCSVEDKTQITRIAKEINGLGVTHLRGGVFYAGTYPGQRFGWKDIDLIKHFHDVAYDFGYKNIIEVLDYSDESFDTVLKYADCLQVGARQMQNYTLLKKVGQSGKPVFLKRHPGSTLDEWLGAAEYILRFGCTDLHLIERGSVSHSNHSRWDLSVSIIAAAKAITNIPIIGDPSHGTGRRDLVKPMALACVAAGADGVLIETHYSPDESHSDSEQAISTKDFKKLASQIIFLNKLIKKG